MRAGECAPDVEKCPTEESICAAWRNRCSSSGAFLLFASRLLPFAIDGGCAVIELGPGDALLRLSNSRPRCTQRPNDEPVPRGRVLLRHLV